MKQIINAGLSPAFIICLITIIFHRKENCTNTSSHIKLYNLYIYVNIHFIEKCMYIS